MSRGERIIREDTKGKKLVNIHDDIIKDGAILYQGEFSKYYFDKDQTVLLQFTKFPITKKRRELLFKFHTKFSFDNKVKSCIINGEEFRIYDYKGIKEEEEINYKALFKQNFDVILDEYELFFKEKVNREELSYKTKRKKDCKTTIQLQLCIYINKRIYLDKLKTVLIGEILGFDHSTISSHLRAIHFFCDGGDRKLTQFFELMKIKFEIKPLDLQSLRGFITVSEYKELLKCTQ